MKKNISSIALMVLLSSTISVGLTLAPAQAGECSAEDPCNTYAMVNDSGLVTNVIVCQPSVCGSGTFAGSKVVLQVPADPVTHEHQGSVYNPAPSTPTEPDRTVHYDDQSGKFWQNNPGVNKTTTLTTETDLDTTKLVTRVNYSKAFFGPEDFKDGRMKMTATVDEKTGADLFLYYYLGDDEKVESLSFSTPQTEEELEFAMAEKNLQLMLEKLMNFTFMLWGWVIPTP